MATLRVIYDVCTNAACPLKDQHQIVSREDWGGPTGFSIALDTSTGKTASEDLVGDHCACGAQMERHSTLEEGDLFDV